MMRFAMILGLGLSLASGAHAAEYDTFADSPGDEPTPEVAGGDTLLADASIPADDAAVPCLPEQRVRLVSREDGKLDLVVSDVSTAACAVPDAPTEPRIYPIVRIDVDPKYAVRDYIAGAAVFRVRRNAAVLEEGGRTARGVADFKWRPLASRVLSIVVLENRCRSGGQTPEETAFLVGPIANGPIVVQDRYATGECRTVAEISTAVPLSPAQIKGYLSLIRGTTRVAAYRSHLDTEDGVLLFRDQVRRLDEHLIDMEKRLSNLQALPRDTSSPFVGWSKNLVRKGIEAVYWEALLEPRNLAGAPWIALEGALNQVRAYYGHLTEIIHEIEKKPGLPRADADALAQFVADERAFWEALTPERTVERPWLQSWANLRATVLQYLAPRSAPPAPSPPAERR